MYPIILKSRKQGSDHVLMGKPCQDSIQVARAGNRTILAVADGHGGNAHMRSGLGSAFAVRSAVELLARGADFEEFPKLLKHRFDRYVKRHLWFHPFSAAEKAALGELPAEFAYGTTLIAAVMEKERVTIYQMGDGEAHVLLGDGSFAPMLPEDPACQGSCTSSMAYPEKEYLQHFRKIKLEEPAAAVFLYSDGYECKASRPYDAAALLREAHVSEEQFEELLRKGDHGDDQSFLYAYDRELIGTDLFRRGLEDTLGASYVEYYLNRLLEKKHREDAWMETALIRLKRLHGMAPKEEQEAFRKKAELHFCRIEQIKKELQLYRTMLGA